MPEVKFGYLDKLGEWHAVTTLEEREYPAYYDQRAADDGSAIDDSGSVEVARPVRTPSEITGEIAPPLFEGHKEFQENQRGVSFESLVGPHLLGASVIIITDPYIRRFHQARNLMELLEVIAVSKDPAEEVTVKLVTSLDADGEEFEAKQLLLLEKIRQGVSVGGVTFEVEFDNSIHDRSIVTSHGWRIQLGRGLDIFQYASGDIFDLASRRQEYRQLKAFGITYVHDPT